MKIKICQSRMIRPMNPEYHLLIQVILARTRIIMHYNPMCQTQITPAQKISAINS